ncbi:hypothetical protein [uncultured Kordia sp.]|uniref:hypothetical protein n=1 Tax=uncultured Kordia sp. TaxID=507699 RepID=UPI0026019128|nr:hypothetical protein [uncultured Kordia sp.]
MNKIFYYALGGQFLVVTGLILFFSNKIDIEIVKILVPILMILAGICSLLFSLYEKLPKIANQFHLGQGIGFVVYGLCILFLVTSLQGFLLTTIYFIMLFGLFELFFAFGVLNSKHSINKQILMSRILAGIVNLIGGFILLMVTFESPQKGLLYASILIAIGGISMLIFSSKVRKFIHE